MKIAIVKRAYRKPANGTWCADPEHLWLVFPKAAMDSAEQLLRFVHTNVAKTAVAAEWDHSKKTVWLGNADISITEGFATVSAQYKSTPPVDKARGAMLNGLAAMKGFDVTVFKEAPPGSPWNEWIKFGNAVAAGTSQTAVAAGTSQTAVEADTNAKVSVLRFEERTGVMRNEQVKFESCAKTSIHIELPWKEWHEQNASLGATQADKASALVLLENIHHRWDVSSVDVKIMLDDGKPSVVAGSKVKTNAIMLPPCIPNKW